MTVSWTHRFGFLVAIGACGSAVACGPATASDASELPPAQAIVRTVDASPTTSSELGVTQWWATIEPSGAVDVAGVDMQSNVVLEFVSGDGNAALRNAAGDFALVPAKQLDTLTPNARAMRTLALLRADFAPVGDGTNLRPTALGADHLQPLDQQDDACAARHLVRNPEVLTNPEALADVCGGVNDSRYKTCMHASGSLVAASTDVYQRSRVSSDCSLDSACSEAKDLTYQWRYELEKNGCGNCAGAWGLDRNAVLKCSNVERQDRLFGVYDTCKPRPQDPCVLDIKLP